MQELNKKLISSSSQFSVAQLNNASKEFLRELAYAEELNITHSTLFKTTSDALCFARSTGGCGCR